MKKFLGVVLLILVLVLAGLLVLTFTGKLDAVTGVIERLAQGNTDDLKDWAQNHGINTGEDSGPMNTDFRTDLPLVEECDEFADSMAVTSGMDILVSLGGCQATVKSGDVSEVQIEAEKVGKLQYYTENGKLVIRALKTYNVSSKDNMMSITVTVPEGLVFAECTVDFGAGSFEVFDLAADVMNVKSGAGKTVGSGLTAGELHAENGAGTLNLHNIAVTGNITVTNRAGTLTLYGTADGNLSTENLAGELVFDGAITGIPTLENVAGATKITLDGDATAYDYNLGCAAGNITVGDEVFTAFAVEKQIDNGAGAVCRIANTAGTTELIFR